MVWTQHALLSFAPLNAWRVYAAVVFPLLGRESAGDCWWSWETLRSDLLLFPCQEFSEELKEGESTKYCFMNVYTCRCTQGGLHTKHCQERERTIEEIIYEAAFTGRKSVLLCWLKGCCQVFQCRKRAFRREARMGIKISLYSFSKRLPEEQKPLMTSCASNSRTQNWKWDESCRAAVTK